MNKKKHKKIQTFFVFIFIIFLIIVILLGFEVISAIKDTPHPEDFSSFQPTQSTKIYDRSGKVLLYEIHGEENRTIVDKSNMSKYAREATVAIEDRNFYTHNSYDIRAILRALYEDIIHGRIVQGGSTITQQLVKNVFLSSRKTIKRKIEEIILASWIEKKYSKDKILTYYLNQVSYGSNAYGIESAAQTFFGKDAKNLTIAESAYLASLIQAPSYYSPWGKNTKQLEFRKNYVLKMMHNLGYIDEEQLQFALNEKVKFLPRNIGFIKAPHFVMMVKKYLENKYGKDVVENGGLKVITTLNWDMQKEAEKDILEGVRRNKKLYNGSNAALVAQDPKTGQILALVGSANYFSKDIDGQFDVATQGLRQPGSTFKPFAYMTAFEEGYTPDTIIFDTPTEFTYNNQACPVYVDYSNKNTKCFHPVNFEGTFIGPVSFKQALAQSINVPAVKVLYLAGIKNAIKTAHEMGITTLNNESKYGLSLVLGSGDVKLVDLVNAYSVFATDGIKHKQSFILEVDDSKGNVLEKYINSSQRVVDAVYPETINRILSNVDLRSGLFHSSLALTKFNGYDVALKTGTSNDYRDAWSIGYTPFLTVGVWAGNNDYKPMKRHGSSLLAAVPMWSKFFGSFIYNYPPDVFQSPKNPLTSTLPMLDGKYIIYNKDNKSPQIHTILYYINKDNPKQLRKEDSSGVDPQFNNWEIPVIEWAKEHVTNFSSIYNKQIYTGTSTINIPTQIKNIENSTSTLN